MAADGLRVAVARDNGLLRDLADIPESALRAVAHVHDDPGPLRPPHEFAPLRRQSAAGHAGAGQRILRIPHRRNHPHALRGQLLQPPRIAAERLRALDRERRAHAAVLQNGRDVRRRPAERNVVFSELLRKIGHRRCKALLIGLRIFDPDRAERKKLDIGREFFRLREADLPAVLSKRFSLAPEFHCGIAMPVQNRIFHQNASSSCRMTGCFVAMPSGA